MTDSGSPNDRRRAKARVLPRGGKARSAQGAPMNAPAEFDVFNTCLDGVNLIEASAGTGKTWNICGLYLRLLLERGLEVQQILVVTFTNAATAELRQRVRSRIVETAAYLRDVDPRSAPEDPFVATLVAAVERRTSTAREQMALLLEQALQYFDEAAIFTIHGFCQRALADASFSAGLPLSLDLIADDREMIMEAVHDFWRRRVAADGCPAELAAYLLQQKDTPETWARLLKRSLAKPLAKCLWPAAIDRPAEDGIADLTAAYEAARTIWATQRNEIVAMLNRSLPALNKSTYKPATIGRAIAAWDAHLREAAPLATIDLEAKPELLSCSRLADRTNRNQPTPRHAFFDAADAVLATRAGVERQLDLVRLRLLRDLLDDAGPELRRRKRERRVIAYDDMLYNLHAALHSGTYPRLAEALRQRFPVALIDEFQDTDPLQFAIFDAVYGAGGTPVFLVGDPKQAIYSFRHADLHAYLRARRRADAEYTLADNQRSTASLIAALNGLFAANPRAFMLPGLEYHAVQMGKKERKPFRDMSLPRADLQVWTLPQADDGDPITKAAARSLAVHATAAEIARLITAATEGRIAIGDRPLSPGDIAVLVRTHAQGSDLKRELARLNVGSVELAQASVFHSPDAEEVERVLIAINQPARDTLLRGALATEMMGCDAAAIAAISSSEERLLACVERFARYRETWQRQGVGVMYRQFLSAEGVSARLLGRADGERRLTNLLHLGEQIHQAAETHGSPDALLRWLQTQRREDAVDEVAQLRLESDRNLVQIITIHKAKGLEFPVVFCPFLWDGRTRFGGRRAEGAEYHDDQGDAVVDFRVAADVGDEQPNIDEQIALEDAAENLRLIYVAFTRAVHRCYLIAGTYGTGGRGKRSPRESTKSLLNWLVAGENELPSAWFAGSRSPADIAAAWAALARRLAPHLDLAPLPAAAGTPVAPTGPAPETLIALPPPERIATPWRISSYSGLTSDATRERAVSDHDGRIGDVAGSAAAPPPAIPPDDILRFPRGPGAGDCLHAIFERIDFTEPRGWNDAIVRALAAHPQFLPGVRAAEQAARLAGMVSGMLANVMRTMLPDGIVLGSIPLPRRLTELEFSLPAPRVSAAALNGALKALGYDVPRLAFRDLEGYLKGFVDLVFEHGGRYYVLDWKSNHLGRAPSDYGPAALAAAMAEHSYHLQHLLYSVAVGRYLKHRIRNYRHDAHFGGVLYLFIRGVRPDWLNPDGTAAGVFHHRPAAATLAQLDALFARTPEGITS